MKKATTGRATLALQGGSSAEKVQKQPSTTSLILPTTTIMVASMAASTIAMVIVASLGEVTQQINTAAIETLFDLITTIFFTMLNVIAAGADSVRTGFMIGIYTGITLSVLYLVNAWLSVRKGWQLVPGWLKGR